MTRSHFGRTVLCAIVLAACLGAGDSFGQEKRALDHDVYGSWNAILSEQLTPDGSWALYVIQPDEGDGTLVARNLTTDAEQRVPRGAEPRVTADGRFAVFTIKPEFEAVREARRAKKKADEQPKDSLGILTLASGNLEKIPRVKSFAVAEEGPSMLAYHLEPAAADTAGAASENESENGNDSNNGDGAGSDLVLRDLASGATRTFPHVQAYQISRDGSRLAYNTAAAGENSAGVFLVSTSEMSPQMVFRGDGEVSRMAMHHEGDVAAFLSNRDDHKADEPEFKLYTWMAGQDSAFMAASSATGALPDDWWVSRHGALEFSEDGRRLFFGTVPVRPAREDIPEDEKVVLDIWNWQDDELQSVQNIRVRQERERSYRAVLQLDNMRVLQLGGEELPTVILGDRGDADAALGISDRPYGREVSWDFPRRSDFYLIDVRTGDRQRIATGAQGNPSLSPTGRYVFWYENADSTWHVFDSETRRTVDVAERIPHPLHYELHDLPFDPFSYGTAGWTEGDRRLLIYDAYDIWSVDPSGNDAARNVTNGIGREREVRFRYARTDPDERSIDPSQPILLSAFDTGTMASGFYSLNLRDQDGPRRLLFSDHRYGTPRKTEREGAFLFTRQSFVEFGDLWVSDMEFRSLRKISDVNPQQSEYIWGTAELVEWISADGELLRGIVHKPEDFDPANEYPMMVYFYERVSETLHQHWAPIPHRSIINPTFYASRGYVVFKPDIPYKIGYPGESAYNSVVPGVLYMIGKGYVDRDRIGVMGHSWGGYQAAYLITRTNIFAAAHAGAPVSNMISAYGGIRWQTGLSRMFQYERTQSRIGGSLWDYPLRYIENSPIFWAYKIETPLLMMHNDHDGAVPWEQGIEMFVAMRRLDKPVWMLNYRDEPHWVLKRQNQLDFARRMQQFFDHYLMDAPMPRWMAEGIRAVDRGYETGFEYMEEPPATRE